MLVTDSTNMILYTKNQTGIKNLLCIIKWPGENINVTINLVVIATVYGLLWLRSIRNRQTTFYVINEEESI